MIIRSAAAATVALGEGIFGSERAFVEQMNAKARELNIRASFHDSWGLSPENRISPLAMAWMARAFIMDYPEVLEITSMRNVRFGGETLMNSNHLLTRFSGADGFKTGFTNPAGYCLIGTAQRGGRRLITVTMGNSLPTRYPDTETLLNFGFANAARILAGQLSGVVYPSTANLIVNDVPRPLSAYNIDGSHYFKLRDIAYLLIGTEAQFEVLWDEVHRSISIISGEPYTPVGGELEIAPGTSRSYSPTASSVYVDGEERQFDAYFIEGNNFFRLRDIAEVMGFDVDWDGETLTIIINTQPIEDDDESDEDAEPGEDAESGEGDTTDENEATDEGAEENGEATNEDAVANDGAA
jgi:hypothetical protein